MRRALSLAALAGLPFAAALSAPWRGVAFGALVGALLLVVGAPAPARAGELVVFERPGCAYCQKFERDVMPIYDKTEEGRRAPLRRVDLSAGVPQDMTLALPVRFTPTFVVVEGGREIGRITGYASDEAFWGLLGALTAQLAPDRP